MIKPLIVGTSYIGDDGAQCYGSRIVELWARLAIGLNFDVPVILIDSNSQIDPLSFLSKYDFTSDIDYLKNRIDNRVVFSFDENVGHLNTTGRDGFGRAFCKGVEIASKYNFTHVAYMDSDIIFSQSVIPIIEKMVRSGVKICCPLDTTYFFIENGLMFYDVKYMIESKFVERYDWENRKRDMNPMAIPEVVFEDLIKDELFLLPLRGMRDDFDRLTVNNISSAFPYGIDYLTHVKDFRVYERFLEMKGIVL